MTLFATDKFFQNHPYIGYEILNNLSNHDLLNLRISRSDLKDFVDNFCLAKIKEWSSSFSLLLNSNSLKMTLDRWQLFPLKPIEKFTRFFVTISEQFNPLSITKSLWIQSGSQAIETRNQKTLDAFIQSKKRYEKDIILLDFIDKFNNPQLNGVIATLNARGDITNPHELAEGVRKWLKNNSSNLGLESVQSLYLCNQRLKAIPPEIKYFTNLERLTLSDNELEELPKEITELKNLKLLDLSNNNLKKLPENFGNLSKLKELSLKNNQLSNLPDSFQSLLSLELINLGKNQFSTLPGNWENLENLKLLILTQNKLKEIPKSLSQNKSLEILLIRNNPITSFPKNWKSLKYLLIDKDQVTIAQKHKKDFPDNCLIRIFMNEKNKQRTLFNDADGLSMCDQFQFTSIYENYFLDMKVLYTYLTKYHNTYLLATNKASLKLRLENYSEIMQTNIKNGLIRFAHHPNKSLFDAGIMAFTFFLIFITLYTRGLK